jgi:hypothetical protein
MSSRAVLCLVGAMVGCAVVFAACNGSGNSAANGDDPIRSLGSRVQSTRYAHDFWLDEAKQGTARWDSAYAICSAYWKHQDGSQPNCGHVYTANFYHTGATAPVRSKSMTVDSSRP